MTATPRSKVTARDERGFGAVSFKRMLMAGGSAVVASIIAGRLLAPLASIPAAVIALGLAIFLTAPQEGMSMALYLLHSLRGLLVTTDEPGPLASALSQIMLIGEDEGMVNGSDLFAPPPDDSRDEHDSIVFLGDSPLEKGVVILSDHPAAPGG